MLVKTSELTGAALDWAVAQLEGEGAIKRWNFNNYKPSVAWEQGGPIIEREEFQIYPARTFGWCSTLNGGGKLNFGPTPLIAAMFCYVASKFGEEIEIPEELI